MRSYAAWFLCALLLLLCANAKLARYDIRQRVFKLATTQAYVDGTETLRKLPQATPALLWEFVAIVIFAVTMQTMATFTVAVPRVVRYKRFDPECFLRAPPLR